MNENVNEKDKKITQLTKKCDKQLDYIYELENKLKECVDEVNKYKNIIENNNNFDMQKNDSKEDVYQIICNTFFNVVSDIIKNKMYLESARRNIISIENLIVRSTDIKEVIEKYTTFLTVNKMIKLWCNMGMLSMNEKLGAAYFSYYFNNKYIRTVRIKKEWVNLVKESMLHD